MLTQKDFEDLGFVKPPKRMSLYNDYIFEQLHYLDMPFYPGGRTHYLWIKHSPEREAIEICEKEYDNDQYEWSVIYQGFCRTKEDLQDLLTTKLFGGDTIEPIEQMIQGLKNTFKRKLPNL